MESNLSHGTTNLSSCRSGALFVESYCTFVKADRVCLSIKGNRDRVNKCGTRVSLSVRTCVQTKSEHHYCARRAIVQAIRELFVKDCQVF